jgi:uncharacterized protein with PIN domain
MTYDIEPENKDLCSYCNNQEIQDYADKLMIDLHGEDYEDNPEFLKEYYKILEEFGLCEECNSELVADMRDDL